MFTNKLIYMISAGTLTNKNFRTDKQQLIDKIKVAVECGTDFVQIREKQLDVSLLFDLAREAVSVAKGSTTKILVNERLDVALSANADGVHLTSTSIPISVARKLAPKPMVIGVSCHTADAIENAIKLEADFATFSPVFRVAGKSTPKGLIELANIVAAFQPFPILGLGGIDESNFTYVLEKASGIASIRFLNSAKNLRSLSK